MIPSREMLGRIDWLNNHYSEVMAWVREDSREQERRRILDTIYRASAFIEHLNDEQQEEMKSIIEHRVCGGCGKIHNNGEAGK